MATSPPTRFPLSRGLLSPRRPPYDGRTYVRHRRLHRQVHRQPPSSSTACAGSNTAATTPPGWPPSTAAGSRPASARAASRRWRICSRKTTAPGQHRHLPHALGHPRPAERRQRTSAFRPVRPVGARAQRRHRELSGRSARRSWKPGTGSARKPTPKSWPTSSASSTTRPAAEHSKARLLEATRAALKQVIGTYGIAVMHLDVPDVLIGARRGSPLSVGLGKGENFLASDPQAVIAHTRRKRSI